MHPSIFIKMPRIQIKHACSTGLSGRAGGVLIYENRNCMSNSMRLHAEQSAVFQLKLKLICNECDKLGIGRLPLCR